ncbi:MAG: diaminopimelate decarboxylase [Bacillota bacterium]
MYRLEQLTLSPAGHLSWGGCDAVELAAAFGTPLYVVDEEQVRERCRQYRSAADRYLGDAEVHYAGKAFLNIAMCQLVEEEELGLDVVSGGELYTALKAGFPADRIILHGSNKSQQELEMALEAGVRIVVDSLSELELLEELVSQGRRARVLLRYTPGVRAGTHRFIETGVADSKFGLPSLDACLEAVGRCLDNPAVSLDGLHCHIGSQIVNVAPFAEATEILTGLLGEVKRRFGAELPLLNLGGGLGVRYRPGDRVPSVDEYLAGLGAVIRASLDREGLKPPRVIIEPGRSIVAEAGITLYRAGVAKEIPGVRRYVSVDGGLPDNPRPALYGAEYHAILANRPRERAELTYTVAGKTCESGDIIIREVNLPEVHRGDLVAVFATGAYNYSMASNYNRLPRPGVVFVRNGHARWVVARETYDDLVARDLPL